MRTGFEERAVGVRGEVLPMVVCAGVRRALANFERRDTHRYRRS